MTNGSLHEKLKPCPNGEVRFAPKLKRIKILTEQNVTPTERYIRVANENVDMALVFTEVAIRNLHQKIRDLQNKDYEPNEIS